MARQPVSAELGRPETPDETAQRKAESSRAYRASQTTRNLVAALLVTLGVVLVIVLAVPRGEAPQTDPIDVAAAARQVEQARDRTVIVPTVPADWAVNAASVQGEGVDAWTIVYAPAGSTQFVRVVQGFDADAAWATRTLRGAAPRDTVEIGGIEWERYEIADPSTAGNVSDALGVQAGTDHILIYGNADPAMLADVAATVAVQIRALEGNAP